ncbi:hypothetical protein CDAR_177911 [Caerostris darwini]|uniref:Uncharacterized protein n=1 Tax=Caerostris darwini TaxID=1538125 RepID=A0AAV4WGX5_9ARAC|nr:hypothetical protein CDAR_177911 [Caerostris darwini]
MLLQRHFTVEGKWLHPPVNGRYLPRERCHVRVTSAIALGSYFGPFVDIISEQSTEAVAADRYRCLSRYGSNLPLFFHLSDSRERLIKKVIGVI